MENNQSSSNPTRSTFFLYIIMKGRRSLKTLRPRRGRHHPFLCLWLFGNKINGINLKKKKGFSRRGQVPDIRHWFTRLSALFDLPKLASSQVIGLNVQRSYRMIDSNLRVLDCIESRPWNVLVHRQLNSYVTVLLAKKKAKKVIIGSIIGRKWNAHGRQDTPYKWVTSQEAKAGSPLCHCCPSSIFQWYAALSRFVPRGTLASCTDFQCLPAPTEPTINWCYEWMVQSTKGPERDGLCAVIKTRARMLAWLHRSSDNRPR